jgi:hypothetical protein
MESAMFQDGKPARNGSLELYWQFGENGSSGRNRQWATFVAKFLSDRLPQRRDFRTLTASRDSAIVPRRDDYWLARRRRPWMVRRADAMPTWKR